VLGKVPFGIVAGDVFINERTDYYGSFGGKIALYDNNGNLLNTISNPALNAGVVSGVQLGPDNTLYVGVDTAPGSGQGGELVHMDSSGNLLGIIHLPSEPYGSGWYYPFGFRVASDGTFWVPQPNTGHTLSTRSSSSTRTAATSRPSSPTTATRWVSPLRNRAATATWSSPTSPTTTG
jgi:hypothetical protein